MIDDVLLTVNNQPPMMGLTHLLNRHELIKFDNKVHLCSRLLPVFSRSLYYVFSMGSLGT